MKWAPRGFGGDRMSPEYIKKQGWHVEGVLVIQIDDERLTWPEREMVRQLGERLYGIKANDVLRQARPDSINIAWNKAVTDARPVRQGEE